MPLQLSFLLLLLLLNLLPCGRVYVLRCCSGSHRLLLVEPSRADWWVQSLNKMKRMHPELSV